MLYLKVRKTKYSDPELSEKIKKTGIKNVAKGLNATKRYIKKLVNGKKVASEQVYYEIKEWVENN